MTQRRHEDQPSRNEDEYFAKQDAELIKQMREKLDAERKEHDRAKTLMKCPRCGGMLIEQMMGNVTVDICAECGGTWLDKGEMDLLRHVEKTGGNVLKGLFDLFGSKSASRK